MTRVALIGVTVAWVIVAAANISYVEFAWRPDIVAAVAAVAAVLTAAFIAVPRSWGLYAAAGAAGIATQCLRAVSIAVALADSPAAVWFGAASIAVTVLAAATFWAWWLSTVATWRRVA